MSSSRPGPYLPFPSNNSASHDTSLPTSLISSISHVCAFCDIAKANTITPSSSPETPSSNSLFPAHTHISEPTINPLNIHSMQTRAKNGIIQPGLNLTLLLTHMEATSVSQALAGPHWFHVMKDEYQIAERGKTEEKIWCVGGFDGRVVADANRERGVELVVEQGLLVVVRVLVGGFAVRERRGFVKEVGRVLRSSEEERGFDVEMAAIGF
ncbi:hypothetical protein KIW84_044815 [Lathyrus oleraceus]|uniref:Uncharacterized protein n=1 Tax=Pisum sativum TaxID=3888 RepID=A0A9D4XJF1_PEA|nr:hypothetical protein KIW84_044815 [Pisum sativum]